MGSSTYTCTYFITILLLSFPSETYTNIYAIPTYSGARSGCTGRIPTSAGMIERLWLPPSGFATLAILSVLLCCACFRATCARSSHSALASIVISTCSFLCSSAMILVPGIRLAAECQARFAVEHSPGIHVPMKLSRSACIATRYTGSTRACPPARFIIHGWSSYGFGTSTWYRI